MRYIFFVEKRGNMTIMLTLASPLLYNSQRFAQNIYILVEGLYCKVPIQCLASSEMYPPPPAFGTGGGHTRLVEWGWGVNSSEDSRHCSVLYICKYCVYILYALIPVVFRCHFHFMFFYIWKT